jgi:carboxyl-terminal processing protease
MRSQSTVPQFSRKFSSIVSALVLVALLASAAPAQGLGPFDRDSAKTMLDLMKQDLKKNYYDPNYHGMDLDKRFQVAEEELKLAQTRDELMISVAQVLLELNDSHTFFVPPIRAARVRYGWRMKMIGDTCFITAVNPNSDAAAKGLKPGDAVLAVDGVKPTPSILWKMNYRYYALIPAAGIRLLVRSPGEQQPHQIDVASKIERTAVSPKFQSSLDEFDTETRELERQTLEGGDVIVWGMPTFAIPPDGIDYMMGKVRKYKTLILDLRGNGGGYTDTLDRLVGYFFDHDVKIADLHGRKKMEPEIAKTRGSDVFKGQVFVLVDSQSASASEMFARIMQLEKRGRVIGDRTAGAVMTAEQFPHKTGVGGTLYFGQVMTTTDVIMSDGKSLEHVGVTPDEFSLPTAADLAAQRDPVLAKVATAAGMPLTPEKAGSLFPLEWLDNKRAR